MSEPAQNGGGSPESLGVEPGSVLDGPRDLGLATSWVGRRVHYEKRVDSTNDVLKDLATSGAAAGTIVLADEQTGGRGRSGRTWFSPASTGIWMSVLLRLELPPERLAPLSIAAAVSVAGALAEQTGLDVRVKWPNDLLIGGRKLAGFLVEAAQTAGGTIESAVLGVGVNVGLAESDIPPELAGVTTSLSIELERPVERLEILRAVAPALEHCLGRYEVEGIAGFRERWRELSSTLGREVTVSPNASRGPTAPLFTGTVTDLAESGALVLSFASGGKREVWFGDVTLRRTKE